MVEDGSCCLLRTHHITSHHVWDWIEQVISHSHSLQFECSKSLHVCCLLLSIRPVERIHQLYIRIIGTRSGTGQDIDFQVTNIQWTGCARCKVILIHVHPCMCHCLIYLQIYQHRSKSNDWPSILHERPVYHFLLTSSHDHDCSVSLISTPTLPP